MQSPFVRDISLDDWLSSGGITEILVISPHMDDAAFSLADTLKALSGLSHVHTVFTEADAESEQHWAKATGFQDAFDEFAQRKPEDEAAMQAIGVPFSHGGIPYCQRTEEAAARMTENVLQHVRGSVLVLLPLGAGKILSAPEKLLRRVLRRPFGSPVHGDHVWVRDHLRQSLAGRDGVRLGYYAEVPYKWSNSMSGLGARAAEMIDGPIRRVTRRPDADFKLSVAEKYRSQLVPIMGDNRVYQRKVCTADEVLFLPEP